MFARYFKENKVLEVKSVALAAFLIFCVGANPVHAEPSLSQEQEFLTVANVGILGQDRDTNNRSNHSSTAKTIEALQLADKEQWARASSLAAQTRSPLVETLVDWMMFQSDEGRKNFNMLAEFVHKNPKWPGQSAILRQAEHLFPDTYPDDYVLQWYGRYTPQTPKGAKRYLEALKSKNYKQQAELFLNEWFVGAILSPQEQNTMTKAFSSLMTQDILTKRLDEALLQGQNTNARAIARLLGSDWSALTEARIGLRAQQKGVNAKINRVPQHLQNDAGLLLDRATWRRRADNYTGATEMLLKMPDMAHKTQAMRKAAWRERHIVIREMIELKRFDTAYQLASTHRQLEGFPKAQAEWMAGWIALRFADQPMQAFHSFKTLYENVETPISKARGAYWAARASEAVGDMNAGKRWYEEAGRYPTVFYGQMALHRLGKAPNYTGRTIALKQNIVFDNIDRVNAAKLLARAGLQDQAKRFVSTLIKDAQNQDVHYEDVAKLAMDLSMPALAISTGKKAESDGVMLLSYAFPEIRTAMQRVNFQDKALVHGLIRQESAFEQQAVSRSGALGLMQLMPATAKETAGKMGLKHRKSWLTQKPDHNIALGTRYLQQLLDRFDGAYPLAIAGYNAGPNRIPRWIKTYGDPRQSNVDMVDWIESIPIYETRNYVQRVMEATRVYADIFNVSPQWDQVHTAYLGHGQTPPRR